METYSVLLDNSSIADVLNRIDNIFNDKVNEPENEKEQQQSESEPKKTFLESENQSDSYRLSCESCGYTYKTRRSLWNHRQRCSSTNTKSSFPPTYLSYPRTCEACGKEYKSRQSYCYHRRSCTSTTAGQSPYKQTCEFCGKTFHRKQLFCFHQKWCDSPTDRLKLYECSECKKQFTKKSSFKRHLEYLTCSTFTQQDKSRQHIDTTKKNQRVRRPKYTCAHCSTMYARKDSLIRHIKRAACSTKQPNFVCWENECSGSFYTQTDLIKHLDFSHNITLSVEKLVFETGEAFEKWKDEEVSSKFIKFRKESKKTRSSGIYRCYACQFSVQKSNRYEPVSIMPQARCPSRILATTRGSKVHVTYISTHNHELYNPIRQSRTYRDPNTPVKGRHIAAMRLSHEDIKLKSTYTWEMRYSEGNQQRAFTIKRINLNCYAQNCLIKCHEEYCIDLCHHLYRCTCRRRNFFCIHMHVVHSLLNRGILQSELEVSNDIASVTQQEEVKNELKINAVESNNDKSQEVEKELMDLSEEVVLDNNDTLRAAEKESLIHSIQNCLSKLNNYVVNKEIEDVLLKQMASSLQSLCQQCDEELPDEGSERFENEDLMIEESTTIKAPIDGDLIFRFLTHVTLFKTKCHLMARDTCEKLLLNTDLVPDIYGWFSKLDLIFVPYEPVDNNWILLIFLPKEKKMCILDPSDASDSITSKYAKYRKLIIRWCEILKTCLRIHPLNICFPPHARQKNASEDCGVFICWYVFQYINQRPLTDNVDLSTFLSFMHDTVGKYITE